MRNRVLLWFLAVAWLLTVTATTAWTQQAVRVRGTIEHVDGQLYSIRTRDQSVLKVRLAPNVGIAASVKSDLSKITPGIYIGVAALSQADGTLRALEAHIFHDSMRGTGEGHRDWDLLPKSTMTNAVVQDVVSAADGHSVTLRYKDGEKLILIPPGTTIVTYLPGSVGELKIGATVFVPGATRYPDGTLEAQRVMVGRDVAPPQ